MENERIRELEKQIAALKSQWPAHSVPPTMFQQLEELEQELERERAGRAVAGLDADVDNG